MALINCPECSKEISDTCEKCIHCGYTFTQSMNNTQKIKAKKHINRKIILGIVTIIIVLFIGLFALPKDNPFEKYTQNLGKHYMELPSDHYFDGYESSIFSIKGSYSPGTVEFDKFGGTFTYTCAAKEILSKYEEGEIISMFWAPDDDYVSDNDAESMLQLLEKTYGKCKNTERDKYSIKCVWENVDGMDITFTASLNGDVGYGYTHYYIHWCEH